MSNGRWGQRASYGTGHIQAVSAMVPDGTPDAIGEPVQYIPHAPTADGLLGQAKVRLEAIEAELRSKAALEAERVKLLKMIAALEGT